MKAVIKVNSIPYNTEQRLLNSGVLSKTMPNDVAYLRLRYYYRQVPLFLYSTEPAAEATDFPMLNCAMLITYLEPQQIVITPQAVCEFIGADIKDVEKVVRQLKLSKVSIPADSILYGLKGDFYSGADIARVLTKLQRNTIKYATSRQHQSRLLAGLNLRHPEGAEGKASAKRLFFAECQKLLNPKPAEAPLTYETLDYNLINWQQVLAHPNFALLEALYNCPNNAYMLRYMAASDPTLQLLQDLAEKAASRSRRAVSDLPEREFTDLTELAVHIMKTTNDRTKLLYPKMLTTLTGSCIRSVDEHIKLLTEFIDTCPIEIHRMLRLPLQDISTVLSAEDGADIPTFVDRHGINIATEAPTTFQKTSILGEDNGDIYVFGAVRILHMFNVLKNVQGQ